MTGFMIGDRKVGDGAPCLIVAEVAQAHEGSIGMAHAYIDAVAAAGADAVKFQCHIAEAESTPDEPWRVKPEWAQDESRYAYWKRMEFAPEQWRDLAVHAAGRGLIFLCSPFSLAAFEMMNPFVPAWKIASGEITHWDLLQAIGETRKPVILSCGMGTDKEIIRARQFLSDASGGYDVMTDEDLAAPCALLLCTSAYPCPPEKIGLERLEWSHPHNSKRRIYSGLSDHSGTIWPSLAAVTLGASIVEVHVCFSKAQFGFDVESSITTDDLARLVEGVRFIEKAKQPVDKDALAKELEPMREIFLRKHERKAVLA